MRRIALVAAILLCACKDKPSSPSPATKGVPDSAPVAGDPVKPGTLKLPRVEATIGVAIPKGGDVAAAEKLARDRAAAFNLEVERTTVADFSYDRDRMAMSPPGFSDADVEGVLEAAAVITIHGASTDGVALLRTIAKDASAVADASHGWVLDPGVSGAFTAEKFHERIASAKPDVRNMIVVHAVGGDGDLPFLDTMGMRRLGLPELYVHASGRGQVERYTTLINVVAQTLLDRGDLGRAGELELDLARLHGDWGLDAIREQGGKGKAKVLLKWSKGSGDHGEAGELSIEIIPPSGPTTEAAEALFDECFGQEEDKLSYAAEDDPELLEAGKRARDELAKMRRPFAKGVPPDEMLSVKAKFTDPSGEVEWMWIDVVRFTGDGVDGTLANTPEIVTNVREGQRVKAKLDDIADYMHTKADGTEVGGYSIEIFRKRGLLD